MSYLFNLIFFNILLSSIQLIKAFFHIVQHLSHTAVWQILCTLHFLHCLLQCESMIMQILSEMLNPLVFTAAPLTSKERWSTCLDVDVLFIMSLPICPWFSLRYFESSETSVIISRIQNRLLRVWTKLRCKTCTLIGG